MTKTRERSESSGSRPGYECKDTHLEIQHETSWGAWKRIGRNVGVILNASPWYVADWVNFGEQRFGEKYTQALDVTGLSPERLRVLSWVGNRFTPRRRRSTLSFEAHRELAYVADDAEQDAILDRAEREGWGAKEIRAWKREQRGESMGGGDSTAIVATFGFDDEELADGAFDEVRLAVRECARELGCTYRLSRPKVDD